MLAIIAAFHQEVGDYLKSHRFSVAERHDYLRLYQSDMKPDVVVIEGGVGREKAEEATRLSIESYRPDYIVSAGFAGGARQGVKAGDLFLCDRLFSLQGPAPFWQPGSANERSMEELDAADDLVDGRDGAREDYSVGGCMSVPDLASGAQMKAWIGATFPVGIIDMESYWVSETAAAHGIRHMVVRSVLDPLEQTLPAFVGKAVDDEARRRWDPCRQISRDEPGTYAAVDASGVADQGGAGIPGKVPRRSRTLGRVVTAIWSISG